MTAVAGAREPQRSVSESLARRARKERLIRLIVVGVILVAIAIAAALIVTGRTIVPVISDRLFAIQYTDEIAEAAGVYGLDPYLVAAVVKAESNYDPQAVSSAGAIGLMQLMPDTAEWIVRLGSWRGSRSPDLTDPGDSILLGSCYLNYLFDIYGGDRLLTLAAYNAGQGTVSEWVKAAGGESAFRLDDIRYDETRTFVEKVEHYRGVYFRTHPETFSGAGQ